MDWERKGWSDMMSSFGQSKACHLLTMASVSARVFKVLFGSCVASLISALALGARTTSPEPHFITGVETHIGDTALVGQERPGKAACSTAFTMAIRRRPRML